MSKNKSYSNEFKFKVALEMVRGDLTVPIETSSDEQYFFTSDSQIS
ncbi:hypothetical protein Sarmat_01085 [Rickettsiales endosymbiont of Paramecium tredecaurelia]|nr:hypothetical protein [Candidatus Sarmatiella mevalonica]